MVVPRVAVAWKPELLPPASGTWHPSAPIRVRLANVPNDVLKRLYFELDGVDVTSFATLQGDVAVLTPGTPLKTGQRELQLLETRPDGSVVERGAWLLEVKAGWRDRVGARVDAVANATERVEEKHVSDLPGRFHPDASAKFDAQLHGDGYGADAKGSLFWDTSAENLGGHQFEIGPYLVQGHAGPATARIGHHGLGLHTLVMSDFERRGTSLTVDGPAGSALTGFSFHGSDVVGVRADPLGVANENDRVSGVSLVDRPWQSPRGTLRFTGVYLSGTAPASGSPLSGVSGDPTLQSGTAWDLRMDGALLGRRIAWFGEYARSRYDFDGPGGAAPERDDAHWVGATFVPFPKLALRSYPVMWKVDVAESAIGSFFRSPANPSAPQDQKSRHVGSELALAGLDVKGRIGRQEDNEDGLDSIPRTRSDQWWVDATFSPAELLKGAAPGPLRWLGMPTLQVMHSAERLATIFVPQDLLNLAAQLGTSSFLPDQRLRSTYYGIDFAGSLFSWGVSHRIVQSDDFANQLYTRDDETEAHVQLAIDQRASVSPYLQVDRNRSRGGSPQSVNWLGGVRVGLEIVPNRLSADVDASLTRSRATGGIPDERIVTTSGSVTWTAVQPAARHPGLSFSLLGTYQNQNDNADPTVFGNVYEAFLRATVTWPVVVGAYRP